MDLLRHRLYDIDLLHLQVCLFTEIFHLIVIFEYDLVKFDKSADSIAVPNQSADGDDEQSQITDIVTKPSDTNIPKKSKQPVSQSLYKILLNKILFL